MPKLRLNVQLSLYALCIIMHTACLWCMITCCCHSLTAIGMVTAQNTFHIRLIGKAFGFHCTSQLAQGMNDQDCKSKLSLPIWQAEHSPLDHRTGLVLEILSQLVLHCVRCKECYGLYKLGLHLRHWGIRPFWKEVWPPTCNVSLLIAGGWWARCAWWIRGYLASPRNWDRQERYSEWNGASWESAAWCGFLLVMLPS